MKQFNVAKPHDFVIIEQLNTETTPMKKLILIITLITACVQFTSAAKLSYIKGDLDQNDTIAIELHSPGNVLKSEGISYKSFDRYFSIISDLFLIEDIYRLDISVNGSSVESCQNIQQRLAQEDNMLIVNQDSCQLVR